MSLAERLSSKFHICPRSFASAKYSFFGQSFSRGHYQPTYQPPEARWNKRSFPFSAIETRKNWNTSLQSCRDSNTSYYKIIVYSFLSTVVTNIYWTNVPVRNVLSRSNYLSRPSSGPFHAVGRFLRTPSPPPEPPSPPSLWARGRCLLERSKFFMLDVLLMTKETVR